jgi:hypothetical protein
MGGYRHIVPLSPERGQTNDQVTTVDSSDGATPKREWQQQAQDMQQLINIMGIGMGNAFGGMY